MELSEKQHDCKNYPKTSQTGGHTNSHLGDVQQAVLDVVRTIHVQLRNSPYQLVSQQYA